MTNVVPFAPPKPKAHRYYCCELTCLAYADISVEVTDENGKYLGEKHFCCDHIPVGEP